MKGLDLSRVFFQEAGLPLLQARFAPYSDRIAAGLVGEGSECFGFDDELSRDHDWSAAFCLWLTPQDFPAIAGDLSAALAALPEGSRIETSLVKTEEGRGRRGVFEIGQFYRRFIGLHEAPRTIPQWRAVPETYFAVVTNGEVFHDPLGRFSAIRNDILAFFPEPLRRKKIAARCATIAQSGQYNLSRCYRRGEFVAAHAALNQFLTDSLSLLFLLNRRFRPFYKWMHRAARSLPVLGELVHGKLMALALIPPAPGQAEGTAQTMELIEDVCAHLAQELRAQGLSTNPGNWLLDHAREVQAGIEDDGLRRLPLLAE